MKPSLEGSLNQPESFRSIHLLAGHPILLQRPVRRFPHAQFLHIFPNDQAGSQRRLFGN